MNISNILGARKSKKTENMIKPLDDNKFVDSENTKVETLEITETPSMVVNSVSANDLDIEKCSVSNNMVNPTTLVSEDKEETANISKHRKIVKVCKAGFEHNRCNVNNQDFVFSFMNLKAVSDGCGSGKHSEIGSQLFGQLFAREVSRFIDCVNKKNTVQLFKYVKDGNIQKFSEHLSKGEIPEEAFLGIVNVVFERMLSICSETAFVFENYCFTILVCLEYEEEFVVYSCGDGFIIKENSEGIMFDKLDDGEYPAYYAYNWIEPASLRDFKEGVEFKVSRYSKADYINVGVASDGLRFFDELYEPEKYKFWDNLSMGKGPQIEMLITRNNKKDKTFKDDISICF